MGRIGTSLGVTNMETTVEWTKPFKNLMGQTTYISKCHRFRIIKKKWSLPRGVSSYLLSDLTRERYKPIDCETLLEAKSVAQDLARTKET